MNKRSYIQTLIQLSNAVFMAVSKSTAIAWKGIERLMLDIDIQIVVKT